jgi:hypothetical protein
MTSLFLYNQQNSERIKAHTLYFYNNFTEY